METSEILKKAGLNDAQAEIYECLLTKGSLTPTDLAKNTSQSRENCYAILKKLIDLELVEQTDDKKTSYHVLNPSNLEILVEKRRKVMAKNEKLVKDNISSLLDVFYANNEFPGARTLEGEDGLKEVLLDTFRVRKDIYLLRTVADVDFWNSSNELRQFFDDYRAQRPLLGIHTYALTPATKHGYKNNLSGRDAALNFHRVWMPVDAYTAPAEIQVYGDKVAIIAYGETQMATIITSPIIAESLRQVIIMLRNSFEKSFPQELEKIHKLI
jgi:sugar-specific transcriptional regulator TrmB